VTGTRDSRSNSGATPAAETACHGDALSFNGAGRPVIVDDQRAEQLGIETPSDSIGDR